MAIRNSKGERQVGRRGKTSVCDLATAAELKAFSEFLTERILWDRNFLGRPHLGLASGNFYELVKRLLPAIGAKLRCRENMVSLARDLGFVIRAYPYGGRSGPTIMETIDLPDGGHGANPSG